MVAEALAELLDARRVGSGKRIALMKGYRACTRRMDEIADVFSNGEPEKPDELGREFHECLDFQRAVEMEAFS
jgi:hypothetical protein